MIKGNGIENLTETVRRLSDGSLADKIPTEGRGEMRDAYVALEQLRKKILEKNTLLSASDERVRRQINAVAHDLKIQIALISGYAESLQDGINDREYLSLIREKCVEMNDYVLKIINDAELSQEMTEKGLRFVKLREFLPPVLKAALAGAAEKSISATVSRIPDVRIAVCGPDFASVLQNVVSNAVRYTPENGKIRIKIYTTLKNLNVSVTDSGPGVAPEDVPFIFERYYTGDKSRGYGNGAGTGLADAREIMERLSGGIKYIERGKPGAKFIIRLPKYL